jgi:hypothetical protein
MLDQLAKQTKKAFGALLGRRHYPDLVAIGFNRRRPPGRTRPVAMITGAILGGVGLPVPGPGRLGPQKPACPAAIVGLVVYVSLLPSTRVRRGRPRPSGGHSPRASSSRIVIIFLPRPCAIAPRPPSTRPCSAASPRIAPAPASSRFLSQAALIADGLTRGRDPPVLSLLRPPDGLPPARASRARPHGPRPPQRSTCGPSAPLSRSTSRS